MDKKNQKSDMEFDYYTIPKFMQEHGKFCLWKLEIKSGKAKPDKISYRINGKRADATNTKHYSSFDETVKVFAKGGYAGIGCFESLRLVDVEDCVVNGQLDERGQDIVDTLDSYTELSPVAYDPDAKSERFDRFIDEVISADRDKALFLQKAFGYDICGDTRYEYITEITGEIIRSFVERIDVYKPEKVPGTRTKKQTICIHWNFIGAVDIPTE